MISPQRPIVHLYYSDLAHESRLLRAARAAVEAGYSSAAMGIGYIAPGLTARQGMAPGVDFFRKTFPAWLRYGGKIGRLLRLPLWSWLAAREAVGLRPAIIQCHSLAAMPAGVLAKMRSPGTKIVYDAHELESERNGWSLPLRRVARFVERMMIRRSDAVIVVGPMIAQWYSKTYGIAAPTVVRNVPDLETARVSPMSIRQKLRLDADAILFVYVGILGSGRGIPALLDAFAGAAPDRHIAFIGYGPFKDKIEASGKLHPNIHYAPAVPTEEVTSFIGDADVGLSVIEDVSLSYHYCLPNKIFEYRHAGLAVLASDLPEMRALLEQYGGGWLAEENMAAISRAIASLSREDVRRTVAEARPLFGWAEERAKYLDVIRELLTA